MSSKIEATSLRWRKSAHSQDNSACVEFAIAGTLAAIRDSKYRRDPANLGIEQPVIRFPVSQWETFVDAALGNGPAPEGLRINRHHDGGVTVSDSNGTALTYTELEWTAFTAAVSDDSFVDVATAA